MAVWRVLILMVFCLSFFAAGWFGCEYESKRLVDGLNRQLADGRDRIAELERTSREAQELVDRLAGRLDTAAGIVDEISSAGGTALEKVRRTIENLRKLKELLNGN